VSVRGPVSYDLLGMPDKEFERLCHRLIRLEHPEVEKPADSSDGGADALLPKSGGGYARAWQAKHFPKRMRWDECLKSFHDGQRNFAPERYTFCFPRNLNKTEQKTFDKHFRGENTEIPVDYWSGSEIQARLSETPEGRAVAKHFFADDGETLEEIKRAAQAKGSLDTPQDALERMKPIGEYLAAGDPYFSYAGSVYGEGAETKPPEGTIMSLSESGEGTTSRIDVVPNDEEAMELHAPKGTMMFPVEVYREAEEALARGEDFTAEGIEVTWEQLPPAFKDEIGQPLRADVTIGRAGPPPPAPWDARVSVENQGDRAQIDVDLRPVAPPDGWDGALEGSRAGLTLRVFMRRVGEGGEAEFKYSYTLSGDPARQQLETLRFMDLIAQPGGTLRIAERRRSEREVTLQTGAPEDTEQLEALRTFLGWVVEIEDWTGVRLPVGPEQFTQENFSAVAEVAAAIRRGGFNVTIGEIEFVAVPSAPAEINKQGPILMRRDLEATLLGKKVPLGPSQIVLEDYEIKELGPDEEGRRRLRIRPGSAEAAKVLEKIGKPKTAKKPPPPPKRKSRKRRRRGRRRGGR
jgi:hypothetical protein